MNDEQNCNNSNIIQTTSIFEQNELINNGTNNNNENNSKLSENNIINSLNQEKKEDNINNLDLICSLNETINNDEAKINVRLSNKKDNIISCFEILKKSCSLSYQNFGNKMINWYTKQNQKLSNLFKENNLTFMTSKIKINEKINNIFQILDNIINSITDQINLLNSYLNDDFFDANYPLEEFIIKNSSCIINGHLLSKIDINSINSEMIMENEDLFEIFQNYYLKRKKYFSSIKSIKIKIKTEKDLDSLNNKIQENQDQEDNYSNKIKSICFEDFNISSPNVARIQITKSLESLEKLKIKKSINVYNSNIYKSIISKSNNLKEIKLERIQLTDKSFKEFISDITKDNSLYKTIKYLSFSNNNLNSIILKSKKIIFEELEMLDFSNNNIYNFSTNNFKLLPNLKILDLSNNNINNNILFEGILKSKKKKKINFISFMSKNIFIYNVKDNNKKYIKYLNENLPLIDYKLRKMNLSFVYNKNNQEEISKLNFSHSINISLTKLNLSFCGLNCETLSKFFTNNFGLINLKKLNLNHNFISMDFFSLFTKEDELSLIDKIEKIDLSFNSLKCESKKDLEKMNVFLENNKCLKILKFKNNLILNIFLKNQDKKEYNDEINKFINISEKKKIRIKCQQEINELIDKDRFKQILFYN